MSNLPPQPSRKSVLTLFLAVGFGFSAFLVILIWVSCVYLSRRKRRILAAKAAAEAEGESDGRVARLSNESQRAKGGREGERGIELGEGGKS